MGEGGPNLKLLLPALLHDLVAGEGQRGSGPLALVGTGSAGSWSHHLSEQEEQGPGFRRRGSQHQPPLALWGRPPVGSTWPRCSPEGFHLLCPEVSSDDMRPQLSHRGQLWGFGSASHRLALWQPCGQWQPESEAGTETREPRAEGIPEHTNSQSQV